MPLPTCPQQYCDPASLVFSYICFFLIIKSKFCNKKTDMTFLEDYFDIIGSNASVFFAIGTILCLNKRNLFVPVCLPLHAECITPPPASRSGNLEAGI